MATSSVSRAVPLRWRAWVAALAGRDPVHAQTAQHSDSSAACTRGSWDQRAGIAVLLVLLFTKLAQLVRDCGATSSVRGSRRAWSGSSACWQRCDPPRVLLRGAVLNKGIDSWFNVEIRTSLDDALALSARRSRRACGAHGRHAARRRRDPDERRPSPGLLESLRRRSAPLNSSWRPSRRGDRGQQGLSADVVPTKC